MQSEVKMWLFDDVLFQREKCADDEVAQVAEFTGKHFLLRSHAILCGLTMYHFTLLMHETGVRMLNNFNDLPQVAHLYNCIHFNRYRSLPWPDMDGLISMVSKEKMFAGPRPKSAEETLERLRLLSQPSDSESRSRNDSKQLGPAAFKVKRAWIVPLVLLARLLVGRYVINEALEICVQDLDQILMEIHYSG